MGLSTGRQTTTEATPEPVTIDTARTAVIVVDMQNDFCSKGEMFDRAGVDISTVQKAVGPTRKVLLAARAAGIKIVYLKMGFRPELSDLGDKDSSNRVRHRPAWQASPEARTRPGYQARVKVPNYMVFAVLVTMFCFFPTGIAAIAWLRTGQ